MTERPREQGRDHDGEDRQTHDLAPENHNAEQDDSGEQADAFADEALGRDAGDYGLDDTEKVPTGDDTDDVQDVVDHMRQMVSSGRIDNSAFNGEPNLDDNEDKYGAEPKEDDLRSDGT